MTESLVETNIYTVFYAFSKLGNALSFASLSSIPKAKCISTKLKKKILMPGSKGLTIDGITVITDEHVSIPRVNTFRAFHFDMVDQE